MELFNKYKNEFFRDITSFGSGWIYILILAIVFMLKQNELLLKLILGFIITFVLTILIRIFYFKNRPNREKYSNVLSKLDASSFPSLHSMRASFLFLTFSEFFNNNYIGIFLFIVSLFVAYSRIYIKKHYFLDVSVGFIFGIIIGLLL